MGAAQIMLIAGKLLGTETEEFSPALYFRAFCEMQRVLYVDAKVANRALDFGMAKQDLRFLF